MSKVSGSCTHPSPGLSIETVGDSLFLSSFLYHAGNWCPHQICRLIGQSRIFSIQLKYIFSYFWGIIFTLPSRTALIAGAASSFVFTNHCREISGSIIVPHRSQVLTLCTSSSVFINFPPSISIVFSRAAATFIAFISSGTPPIIFPSKSITVKVGSSCLSPIS
ncbi:MAG: hypothetical protein UX52_C0015G0001 [Candidatus Amesbacteria bacterium GW2011_GWA1_46_35]|nr:MAG: hypothetical protein UX52_C0015G0001 [Candidatus Amesbacteria bacterium GW2011_GWA1_46_35]